MLKKFKRKKKDNFSPIKKVRNEPEFWMNSGRLFCNKKSWNFNIGIYRIMWRGTEGRVILHGQMPEVRELVDFPEGAMLELSIKEYGDISIYDEGDITIRFHNCEVRNKWIPRAIAIHPYWRDTLSLFVEVGCKIEIVSHEK